jgi:hypothetical protein
MLSHTKPKLKIVPDFEFVRPVVGIGNPCGILYFTLADAQNYGSETLR